jgi:T5orf172 domain
MNQQSLAYEMPAKAKSTPDIRLDSKEDSSSASPGSTGEKTNDTITPSRQANSTGLKQGTLMNWLKISKSTGNLNTDTARDIGTDTKRALGTESKRNEDDQFVVPEGAFGFTIRASRPFNGAPSDVKQPALNQDVWPHFDFQEVSSSPRLFTTSLEEAHPTPLINGTPQRRGPAAVPSVNWFFSKSLATPSPFHGREAALSGDLSDLNFHSNLSPLHGGEAASPSGIVHSSPITDLLRLRNSASGNAALSGHLREGKIASRPFQPETPVRRKEGDRTQSVNTISAERQGPIDRNTYRLPSQTSTLIAWNNSAPPKVSSTHLPKIRLPSPNTDEDSEDSQTYHSASSTSPHTPYRLRIPGSQEGDEYFGSSPPFNEESGVEDDSLALVLSSPSPARRRKSVSRALIRSPSPGGLDVIWVWTIAERRKKMTQAFFWIAQHLRRDLTQTEIPARYIYAFKVKDPQGKDYVKIGVASNTKRRIKDHKRCYGECHQIYPPQGEESVLVDHASRVESLIHAELVEQAMLLERCPRYQQKHTCHSEWFDVEERHAIAVIRKWTEWMNTSPYEKKHIAGMGQKWRLKILEQNIMMKLCWPLDPWATMRDDKDIDDIGTSMQLITVS